MLAVAHDEGFEMMHLPARSMLCGTLEGRPILPEKAATAMRQLASWVVID
jgi:hypothetical protein